MRRAPPKVIQPGGDYGRICEDGVSSIRDIAPEGGLVVGGELLGPDWIEAHMPELVKLLKGPKWRQGRVK